MKKAKFQGRYISMLITALLIWGAVTVPTAEAKDFTPVTGIIGVPGAIAAGTFVYLPETVTPTDAFFNNINWTVVSGMGAEISGNRLYAAQEGVVTVRATVAGGAGIGRPFVRDFRITVITEAVNIAGVPAEVGVGNPLYLTGTVEPAHASGRTIIWTLAEARGTGAVLVGNRLTAPRAGAVTVRATVIGAAIRGGLVADFVRDFDITILSLLPTVQIAGGTFVMGSPSRESGSSHDERPMRRVTISSFYMGAHEVTQSQWHKIMGTELTNPLMANRPVVNVTWFEAVQFANRLSEMSGLTPAYTINGTQVEWNRAANGYRLPTEAEWEFAARAGTSSPWNTGSRITETQANFWGTATMNAGSFAPNAWGLYDMHGNVWEWVWDLYGGYPSVDETNPTGAHGGYYRLARGGSWVNAAARIRSAIRYPLAPDFQEVYLGFRVARSIGEER